MAEFIIAILLVLLTIYVVPFVVYGGASILGGLRPPTTASPGRFLLGVMVTKLGAAVAFVSIFALSRAIWDQRWLLYAMLWFVMFAFSELGEAVAGRTTKQEAILGVVSEAVYAPLSAYIAQWFLGRGGA